MRSYGQYCALAKALDMIGDRWTLLIVRELLVQGGCRYTDLREGLPGIASNLLVDRLREMERTGLVRREEAPPPVATTLFHLSDRGRELEQVLLQLGRWGAPLLDNPPETDTFRLHWLALPAKTCLKDWDPKKHPIQIELRGGDQTMVIVAGDGTLAIHAGPATEADAVITGKPQTIGALLVGKLSLEQAKEAGLTYEGDRDALRRVQGR